MERPVIQDYLKLLSAACPEISNEELDFVRKNVQVIALNKKVVFQAEGQIQKNLGFLSSGLLRAFYIDQQGNEMTTGFVQQGEYAVHYESFSKQQPSKYTFICLEPSILVNLPHEQLTEGINRYENLERYARIFKENMVIRQESRIESLLNETGEERYLRFVEEHPNLFHRISLTHLSSYLGLGRQTISRIRNKIVKV